MVLDSSAVIAILQGESENRRFVSAIHADQVRLISAATVLELSIVLTGRKSARALDDVDQFLKDIGVEVVPMDEAQMRAARNAFLRFGKGRHAAGLNFGDCISYALAHVTGEPLLFKGTDFGMTDVTIVET